MSKKKSSKKQKEAEARTKVNGHAAFENGKLVTPKPKTAIDQLLEMQKKKEQLKAQEPATLDEAKEVIEKLRAKLKGTRAPKLEDLPDEENCSIQYINFCQVQKYRDELKYILEEVSKIPGIEVRNNMYCDCYRFNNTLVGEVFCLKRQWSARVIPNRVRRWDTADEYLEALKARIAEIPAKVEPEQKKPVVKIKTSKVENIDDIKKRIENLSEGHNAIHLKSVTPEIEALAKDNSYKLLKSEAGGYDLIVSQLP